MIAMKTVKITEKYIKNRNISALLSEKPLAKGWDTKEEDEAWKDL